MGKYAWKDVVEYGTDSMGFWMIITQNDVPYYSI